VDVLYIVFAVLIGLVTFVWCLSVAFFANDTAALLLGFVPPLLMIMLTTFCLANQRTTGRMKWAVYCAAPSILLAGMLSVGRIRDGDPRAAVMWFLLAIAVGVGCSVSAIVGAKRRPVPGHDSDSMT
jgi:hypothetical protein